MERVLVDMSCTLLHHGHIRLLKKASKYGKVIVALTTDDEIFLKKGYWPELSYQHRYEIISAIKYVHKVIPSKWLLTNDFIKLHKIDTLVHGDDNSNIIDACKIKIFARTKGISSSELRRKSSEIYSSTKLE